LATKIRLQLVGRKKNPFYHISVMNSTSKRDGKSIEKLGYYDAIRHIGKINTDRYNYWLKCGAKPTERVKSILKKLSSKS